MEKDRIVYPYIIDYMRKVRRPRSGKLGQLETWARKEGYPVSEPETSDLLEIICRLKMPKKILEIGTCVGFSALLMHDACGAEITTVDRYEAMYSVAEKNFAEFGVNDINLIKGDAVDVLPTLTDSYDLIFIDAAKGQYPVFLKECLRLLAPDGVIIADNIFFNGYVAEGKPDRHRNKTIVMRLDEFITSLEAEEGLKTVLLPISDGVSLSYKLTSHGGAV